MNTSNENTEVSSSDQSSRPPSCQSWGVGHRVHWVQGMRSNNSEQPGSYEACTVIDASDDGWFTVVITSTGEAFRYWNHDPDAVGRMVGRENLEINQRWSVMHRRIANRCSTDYVSVSIEARPCVFDDPTGPLHEQLETHGGFSISGPDALRLLAEANGEADDPSSD